MTVSAASGAVGSTDNPISDVPAAANNAAEIGTDPVPAPSETPVVDTVAPAVADAVPDPPAEPTDGGGATDDLRETVNGLAQTVTGLVETVRGLLPNDDAPTKMPWTHFGSRG